MSMCESVDVVRERDTDAAVRGEAQRLEGRSASHIGIVHSSARGIAAAVSRWRCCRCTLTRMRVNDGLSDWIRLELWRSLDWSLATALSQKKSKPTEAGATQKKARALHTLSDQATAKIVKVIEILLDAVEWCYEQWIKRGWRNLDVVAHSFAFAASLHDDDGEQRCNSLWKPFVRTASIDIIVWNRIEGRMSW